MTSKEWNPPDQAARQLIAEDLDTCMLVEAAAGTGKTTCMVHRIVLLLASGRCRMENIAAVTFTRKSAADLKTRLQSGLMKATAEADHQERERLRSATDQMDRLFVGTIHSFCGMLLRERPIEAAVSLDFEEWDEEADSFQASEAFDAFISQTYHNQSPHLKSLEDLGLDIKDLVGAYHRLSKYPDIDEWPAPPVDLPDLQPIADELRSYVRHMEEIAPQFPVDRGNDKLMDQYDEMVRRCRGVDFRVPKELMSILAECKSRTVIQKQWPGGQSQAKEEMERWTDFVTRVAEPTYQVWLEKRYSVVMPILQEAVRFYADHRRAAGALNYQDLLVFAAQLLRDHLDVRKYLKRRFTHLLVDEFQDTDPIQAEVMMLLTSDSESERDWRKCRPKPGSLFVVGDPKQSIYRFRRADIATYNQVRAIIEQSGGRVVPLTANFRSQEHLVTWNNHCFEQLLPATATEYSPAACSMTIGRREVSQGALSGLCRLVIPDGVSRLEDAVEFEAGFIARFIRHSLDKQINVPRCEKDAILGPQVKASDFLIITGKKEYLGVYAEKLRELGVPHEVSGASVLGSLEELSLLISILKSCMNPADEVQFVGVLRSFLFGFSDAELFTFRQSGGQFSPWSSISEELPDALRTRFEDAFTRINRYRRWSINLPAIAAIERIINDTGLLARTVSDPEGLKAGSLLKALERLRSQIGPHGSFADAVEALEDLRDNPNAEFDGASAHALNGDVVRIMNLHKAKGLEAPVVFLACPSGKNNPNPTLHIDRQEGRVRGYLVIQSPQRGWRTSEVLAQPVSWDTVRSTAIQFEQAENNRLLYVAATRAGTQLVVTDRTKKSTYWSAFSPFLKNAAELKDPGPPAKRRVSSLKVTKNAVAKRLADQQARCIAIHEPSYAVAAAKAMVLTPSHLHQATPTGEHGTEWGTVIHFLLEARMRNPQADLETLARLALGEQGLDESLVDEAVRIVCQVVSSEIWQRAEACPLRLFEVPISATLPASEERARPTLVRGVIDLVFREASGWVIVDYKTDRVSAKDLPKLVEHYRPQVDLYARLWASAAQDSVAAAGLYFTELNEFVEVP